MKASTARTRLTLGAIGATALIATPIAVIGGLGSASAASTTQAGTVVARVSGGHTTDPRDHGRPVVLVAAALGVPTEVFRTAFTGVTPAAAGAAPEPDQVQANKAALLAVLAPYGVTNERLDTVSDYYRYQGSKGEMWPTKAATAQAVVRHGKVVSVKLLDGGSGYSSAPVITIPGVPSAKVKATVGYGTDFPSNGQVTALTLTRG